MPLSKQEKERYAKEYKAYKEGLKKAIKPFIEKKSHKQLNDNNILSKDTRGFLGRQSGGMALPAYPLLRSEIESKLGKA